MEKTMVAAARWIGICSIIGSTILMLGFYFALKSQTKELAKALERSSANMRVVVPGEIRLTTDGRLSLFTSDGQRSDPLQMRIEFAGEKSPLPLGPVRVQLGDGE